MRNLLESQEKKIEELSTLSTTVERSHDDQCFRIKIEQEEEIKGLKKQVSVLKRLNTNLEKKCLMSSTSIDSKFDQDN